MQQFIDVSSKGNFGDAVRHRGPHRVAYFRLVWTDSTSMRCMTNHLLVSRCDGDCAVAIDTLGGREAELAPAINGSSNASSPWMRLAGVSAHRAV